MAATSGIKIDDTALFNSGPATMREGPLQRAVQRAAYPGLDGVSSLDLGRRGRRYQQSGALVATGATVLAAQEALSALIAPIEAKADGLSTHTLADDLGHSINGTVLVGPLTLVSERNVAKTAEGYEASVDYVIHYEDTRA